MSSHCRLCGQQASIQEASRDSNDRRVTCIRCGTYVAPATTWAKYENMGAEPTDRHLLSALTRTAPLRGVGPLRVDDSWFKKLREGGIRVPTFTERRDAL